MFVGTFLLFPTTNIVEIGILVQLNHQALFFLRGFPEYNNQSAENVQSFAHSYEKSNINVFLHHQSVQSKTYKNFLSSEMYFLNEDPRQHSKTNLETTAS